MLAKHEYISAPAKKAAKVDNEWDGELLKWANTQELEVEEKVAEIPAATHDNPEIRAQAVPRLPIQPVQVVPRLPTRLQALQVTNIYISWN
eukprot:gene12887-3771_t